MTAAIAEIEIGPLYTTQNQKSWSNSEETVKTHYNLISRKEILVA